MRDEVEVALRVATGHPDAPTSHAAMSIAAAELAVEHARLSTEMRRLRAVERDVLREVEGAFIGRGAARSAAVAALRARLDALRCSCCNGDPLTACSACRSHACWAGNLMCGSARTAGTVQLDGPF